MFIGYGPQLTEFLSKLAESLDISESLFEAAENRYLAMGRWLERPGSLLVGLKPEIYPQGSFRLGTAIKPFTGNEEYDVDLVCRVDVSSLRYSQLKLKQLVGDEIKSYAAAQNMNSAPEEGRRCWTLNYADGAMFHMDILPAIPDEFLRKSTLVERDVPEELLVHAIAITDNTLDNYSQISTEWQKSNPIGYAEWFKERMKQQFELQKSAMLKMAKAQDIPDYKIKTPLQKAIQLLKRHRDIMFYADQDDKPISIIITTLAAKAYNNESDLADALYNIVNCMASFIEDRNGVAWVPNPVNPLENFADKWIEHPERKKNFYKWLTQVQLDFSNNLQTSDFQSKSDELKQMFGDKAVTEVLKASGISTSSATGQILSKTAYPLGRFDVPHRKPLKWPLEIKGKVNVEAWVVKNGFRPRQIQSGSTELAKHLSLQFEASTSIFWPYKVYWQVVNTGPEAEAADGLRGGYYDCSVEKGRKMRKESTLYTGTHWIECFIVKNGVCVARSGEFVVKIQ